MSGVGIAKDGTPQIVVLILPKLLPRLGVSFLFWWCRVVPRLQVVPGIERNTGEGMVSMKVPRALQIELDLVQSIDSNAIVKMKGGVGFKLKDHNRRRMIGGCSIRCGQLRQGIRQAKGIVQQDGMRRIVGNATPIASKSNHPCRRR